MDISLLQELLDVIEQKKQLEQKEKSLRQSIIQAMECEQIRCFNTALARVQYFHASTYDKIDTDFLKDHYPDIARACTVQKERNPFISVYPKTTH